MLQKSKVFDWRITISVRFTNCSMPLSDIKILLLSSNVYMWVVFKLSWENMQIWNLRFPRGRLSIFSSRIFRYFPIILDLLEHKNESQECYRIICFENNEYQGLKSDKISFRVDNTAILWSDANWGCKLKPNFSDFKRDLATLWRFQGSVNIMFK